MKIANLNTAFKQKSNTPFNNMPISDRKISLMHETMKRLYHAAEKLKEIRGQSNLARALNASPQTVKNWEARGISKQGMLDAQDLLGISATWIDSGFGPMGIDIPLTLGLRDHLARQTVDDGGMVAEQLAEYSVFQSSRDGVSPGPDIRGLVPLISWVQAGAWESIVDNFSAGDAEVWMPCIKRVGAHAFALRVRGISMEPKYQDGDIIFVDPDAAAEHGKNVVVRMEDDQEATFKQLIIEGEHKFLRPLNPDWPGPKLIQINGNATICGVVIGKWVPE